jgi:hypothetical protein
MKKQDIKNQLADGSVPRTRIERVVAEGSNIRIFWKLPSQDSSYNEAYMGCLKRTPAGVAFRYLEHSDNHECKKIERRHKKYS